MIKIETDMDLLQKPDATEPHMMALCADYRIVPIESMTIGDSGHDSENDRSLTISMTNNFLLYPGMKKDSICLLVHEFLKGRNHDMIFHVLYGSDSSEDGLYHIEKCVELVCEGLHSFMITHRNSHCKFVFCKSQISLFENKELIRKIIKRLPRW